MKFSEKEKQRLRSKYGEWAVITGASSGIGKELAYRVGEVGLNIILVARNQEALQQIKAELEQKFQIQVEVVSCDLGKDDYQKIARSN